MNGGLIATRSSAIALWSIISLVSCGKSPQAIPADFVESSVTSREIDALVIARENREVTLFSERYGPPDFEIRDAAFKAVYGSRGDTTYVRRPYSCWNHYVVIVTPSAHYRRRPSDASLDELEMLVDVGSHRARLMGHPELFRGRHSGAFSRDASELECLDKAAPRSKR